MTGIEAGKTWSRIGPQDVPTSGSASGIWQLNEAAEYIGSGDWPAPTAGHWTFLGDPEKASGQPISLYSEGGLYQTAAQASAGNNEHLIVARVTDNTGITGSAVAIINGLRINGNAPASGTISFNKGSWWSLSNGIQFQQRGSVIAEDSSGNIYIQYAGYVGGTYWPPKRFSRIIKLNSSLAEQVAYSYKNTANVNDGLRYGTLTFMNDELMSMADCYEPQMFGQIKIAKSWNKHSTSTLQEGGQGYHIDGNGNSDSASQLFSNHIVQNTGATSGQTANVALQNYDDQLGTTRPQIQLFQLTWNGSSSSYNTTMDFTLASSSTGGDNYYLMDMESEGNDFFVLGWGTANSVVSGSKNYGAICKYTWGDATGTVDFYVMKLQAGGKNESMTPYSICLDYANNACYVHGQATNIGASNTALSSVWIAKLNLDSSSKKPTSLAWINSYCNEDFACYPKSGRNGLKLTANNTITSFGYSQNQANPSYAPAVISLITVPTDGSSKGGAGSIGSCSVTSHDISSFTLYQASAASTNVTLAAYQSGVTNMTLNTGNVLANADAQGTSNYTTLVPDPQEYIGGGV
jgi:hypothetical protein